MTQQYIVNDSSYLHFFSIQVEPFTTDFGIGIPKSEQRKVFDPLYRSTGAKKDNYTGLGLGLFITKEIIKKHGGSLRLLSTEGKGTVITVQLPLHSHKAAKK